MVIPEQTGIVPAEKRIAELGIHLPPAPQPLGAYVEAVESGRLLFLTGMMPVLAGKPQYVGVLGKGLSVDDGRDSARIAVLNALAVARQHLGSLDRITRVLKTEVYLVATEDFVAQLPKIADGASELLRDVFGARGLSVRKVIGATVLPLNVPVLVELLYEIKP
ncbi:RidA family protein [Silvibacterium sp.]|uniref:RidA family protein n=1 Tax=Silvibacterium sp. TaxID=1964179 RepID=UPI0039E5DCD3